MKRVTDTLCVFRIHLARLRAEAGPFVLAALIFPSAMYLFTNAIGQHENQMRFLAGSIVCSLSLTAISWLGYLLLENRFTGRLKLFATLPLAPSSYVFGVLLFALAQAVLGTATLLIVARALGVRATLNPVALILIIMPTMLCLCGISVVIATRARSFSEGSLLTDSLGAGLIFAAPVFYAADSMPRAIGQVTQWLPTAYAASAVQTTLAGGGIPIGSIAMLAAMAVATLLLGFKLMKWREE